jgi:hypothetical protein
MAATGTNVAESVIVTAKIQLFWKTKAKEPRISNLEWLKIKNSVLLQAVSTHQIKQEYERLRNQKQLFGLFPLQRP